MKISIILIVMTIAGIVPLIETETNSSNTAFNYPELLSFNGHVLQAEPMSRAEAVFYRDFPGEVRYFGLKDGPGEKLLLRYIDRPSRLVHSIRVCYKANGYALENKDNITITVDELSSRPLTWSQFVVNENDHKYLVRQTIISLSDDSNYADIPAWYWLCTFSDDDTGPWLAITWKLPMRE